MLILTRALSLRGGVLNNVRKKFFDESLGILYEKFTEEYGGIATFINRMEAPASSEASYDKASELPKVISDLAVFSDAVFYSSSSKFLCLFVYSEISGPITKDEKIKIDESLQSSGLTSVLISVFSTRFEFSQVANQIAWGTKVWIANEPNHMIHYDDKPVMQAR